MRPLERRAWAPGRTWVPRLRPWWQRQAAHANSPERARGPRMPGLLAPLRPASKTAMRRTPCGGVFRARRSGAIKKRTPRQVQAQQDDPPGRARAAQARAQAGRSRRARRRRSRARWRPRWPRCASTRTRSARCSCAAWSATAAGTRPRSSTSRSSPGPSTTSHTQSESALRPGPRRCASQQRVWSLGARVFREPTRIERLCSVLQQTAVVLVARRAPPAVCRHCAAGGGPGWWRRRLLSAGPATDDPLVKRL